MPTLRNRYVIGAASIGGGAALEDQPWQKPSDWPDIRSGAIVNSAYFLVAHSADYTLHNTFGITAIVSNSGTYDVFVDGIKVATTASGTATDLTWSTLALTSGWDVTYPSNLRVHIVRVTTTSSSNTFTRWTKGTNNNTGVLWAHFTNKSSVGMPFLLDGATLLESVTAYGGEIKNNDPYVTFRNTPNLKHLDTLDCTGSAYEIANFLSCDSVRTNGIPLVKIKGITTSNSLTGFLNANIKKLQLENASLLCGSTSYFQGNPNLKSLPDGIYFNSSVTNISNMLSGCTSLQDTFLDISDATAATLLTIGGSSDKRIDGLKGITVSSSAPFSGTSPQIDVSYTGLDRGALVNLFNSMPTVTDSQVINVTGAIGATDLTDTDLAIATGKGWTVTR